MGISLSFAALVEARVVLLRVEEREVAVVLLGARVVGSTSSFVCWMECVKRPLLLPSLCSSSPPPTPTPGTVSGPTFWRLEAQVDWTRARQIYDIRPGSVRYEWREAVKYIIETHVFHAEWVPIVRADKHLRGGSSTTPAAAASSSVSGSAAAAETATAEFATAVAAIAQRHIRLRRVPR